MEYLLIGSPGQPIMVVVQTGIPVTFGLLEFESVLA